MRVFDGHNDVLSRLWCAGDDPVRRFARNEGHINQAAAKAGGFGGGFFALYAPSARRPYDFRGFRGHAMPLPAPMDHATALVPVMAQVGILRQLGAAGMVTQCISASDIRQVMDTGGIAALLHLEGAECIDPDLLVLDALHGLGLRSLGPVWSRPTPWGEGVPFGYDRDGDTGPGLTADGKRLIARCADLGMVVDTSHLTMKGFEDIAAAGLPLVATHSNAWDLAPVTRNLTQAQLRAIGETGGMVGLNYATVFLSPEGWRSGRATLEDCLRQLDALIEGTGEDHVGLGSDFDGAPLPDGLQSCADLPALIAAMRAHGYGEPLIGKLTSGNWLRFLRDALGG